MRPLKTVSEFSQQGPFSEGQTRWMIFNEQENGLAAAGAIVRIGRRVYIDTDKFDAWIDKQNHQPPQAVA
jgi:hypothetical protein